MTNRERVLELMAQLSLARDTYEDECLLEIAFNEAEARGRRQGLEEATRNKPKKLLHKAHPIPWDRNVCNDKYDGRGTYKWGLVTCEACLAKKPKRKSSGGVRSNDD